MDVNWNAPLLTPAEAHERAERLLDVFHENPDALSPDEQALAMTLHVLRERLYSIVDGIPKPFLVRP